ncbi:hypothetical protein MMC30_002193 [Trapelia coarctata]|nr:hypothetical protein [Trapelia coarctata]
MSSPLSSGASIRNVQLSQRQRRFDLRSSSLRGLNLFHKKAEPKYSEPIEPYEVAPGTGILSTDATAVVFGYLDREKQEKFEVEKRNKKSKRKNQVARDKKSIRNRSRSPVKKAYDRYREVHADDGTDDFRNRTHRKHVEAEVQALQEKRDDSFRIWKESQERSKRGRMVSEEDKLQVRGANPRTGIVTPNVDTARNSSDSGYASDYLKARPHHGPTYNQGSWQQKDNGWSLVEDQDLHYHRQTKPAKKPENENLLETGADMSANPHVDNEQILRYQKSIRRAFRDDQKGTPFISPDTPPSPKQLTPEGPSSPPEKLIKIPRKKVGSGLSRRSESEDTVVINGRLRASSVPPPREYSKQRQRVRVLTPQHPSAGPPRGHTHLHNPKPFLGQPLGTRSNQYPSQLAVRVKGAHPFDQKAASKLSTHPNPTYMLHQSRKFNQYQDNTHSHGHSPVPTATHPHYPPTSMLSLAQNLPAVHFAHPSRFNNLSPDYLLPNLRPRYHRESPSLPDVMGAPITTITTTTSTPPAVPAQSHSPSRPKPYGLDGMTSIPKLNCQSAEPSSSPSRSLSPSSTMHLQQTARTITDVVTVEPEDGYVLQQKTVNYQRHIAGKQLKSQNLPPSPAWQNPTAMPPMRGPVPPVLDTTMNIQQPRMTSNTYTGWVVTDEALTIPAPYPVTPEPRRQGLPGEAVSAENEFTKRVVATRSKIKGLRVGSGNTPAGDGQWRGGTQAGDGCIPMYDGLDEGVESMFEGMTPRMDGASELKVQVRAKKVRESGKSDQSRTGSGQKPQDFNGKAAMCNVSRNDSFKRRISEAKSLCRSVDLHFRPYAAVQSGIRTLIVMVHHVIMTFNPSSKALLALRKEDTKADDYWGAVKDVLWATAYVMLLVNLLLVLGRVVRVLLRFASVVLGPVRVVWVIVRWCLLG